MRLKLFLVLIIFSSTAVMFAQNTYDFLRLDMSARAAALGGTFVSNNDDAEVIFYNPAGMELLQGNPASFSFVKHLLDINLASLAFSTEVKNIGRFGAALKYINYGSFTEADEFGNKTGEFNANEAAFLIGYANSIDINFYYGANIKFIYSGIADRNSTAVAADLGLHYVIPSEEINIGFSILNAGSQLSSYYSTKENLPLDMVFGVSKKLSHLPLKLSFDFHNLNDGDNGFGGRFKAFSVGAEFQLSKVLNLRLGYNNERRSELKVGTTAGIAGFNVGIGANISEYRFDYGYSSMGLIGELHRVTIATTF